MTTGILNSINTKDGLYKTILKTGTHNDGYRVAKVLESYFSIFLMENSILYAKIAVSEKYFFPKTQF